MEPSATRCRSSCASPRGARLTSHDQEVSNAVKTPSHLDTFIHKEVVVFTVLPVIRATVARWRRRAAGGGATLRRQAGIPASLFWTVAVLLLGSWVIRLTVSYLRGNTKQT